ncbi:hypothetical protein INT48_001592 [Thamnidium elegans]|uniref:Uncharacterized protein n=1 Tax=Thamnidium elegans TaxID=101142 RepID=A0A8H7SRM1_9FUNG|nr:hypothetical protein INT48_001592 [Thamnidium elegans]
MISPEYDRNIYGVTPPREPDEDMHLIKRTPNNPTLDPESLNNAITLLKARLQYAQLKIKTGLTSEQLQQLEPAFLSSPRQPRIPLPQEYPPHPAHFSARSRKLKRLLLSAISPRHTTWRKKKIQQQDEEEAARTILMLASSTPPPPATPTESNCIGLRSPDINQVRFQLPPYQKKKKRVTSLYDAVAKIPNYEEKARRIGKSLPKRKGSMHGTPSRLPPAVVCHSNQDTGSPHQYYQYNRPLPYPPNYYENSLLPEDPFYSRPIIPNNLSNSRYKPPPSPPLTQKTINLDS